MFSLLIVFKIAVKITDNIISASLTILSIFYKIIIMKKL